MQYLEGDEHGEQSLAGRPRLMALDCLLVLLTAAVGYASMAGWISQVGLADDQPVRFSEADVRGGMLLLLGTLPLLWRRQAAIPVFAVSSATFLLYEALGYALPPLPFAPLIALYTVAATRALGASAAAVGGMLLGVTAVEALQNGLVADDKFLAYFISTVAAWTLGYGMQVNRARIAQAEEAAAQLTREQAGRTQRAVRQEQRRIARELHDVVAHNVCLIVAQAAAAGRVRPVGPDQARRTLGSIERIGREALAEMRLLLHVLGSDDGGGTERTPQPRLDRLPALVTQLEQAGLPVQLTVQGTPHPLPTAIELNAYRIVQEALTNCLKHAGPARAEVILRYQPDALILHVRDSGTGNPDGVIPGNGIVGMRQRAALLGGTLAVGPQPTGGFLITAEIPVHTAPRLASNGERSWVSQS